MHLGQMQREATENDALQKMLDDERAAKKVAADAADRFRDVLSECLGHPDENPGDDALVAELREHFGKTGPEPTRWRDFCSGALAVVDQINAERTPIPPNPFEFECCASGRCEVCSPGFEW